MINYSPVNIEVFTRQKKENSLFSSITAHQNEIVIESEEQCAELNETEPIVLSTEQHSSPTPASVPNPIDNGSEKSCRPVIRLKRIPLSDAESFLPLAWQIRNKTLIDSFSNVCKPFRFLAKSKVGRKRGRKKLSTVLSPGKKKNPSTAKVPLPTNPDESMSICFRVTSP